MNDSKQHKNQLNNWFAICRQYNELNKTIDVFKAECDNLPNISIKGKMVLPNKDKYLKGRK